MSDSQSAVVEQDAPEIAKRSAASPTKPRRQPRYNVILWDDSEHTFDYVISMLQQLFGHELGRAKSMAAEVDANGRVICLTTTMEHAELKMEQIHAFGKDPMATKCAGSMSASIEPIS
ncbi:ATP-dependent Clp protease adaptor ClpS [Aureliella helgolandensis]|uniref:ATP-dependent Clp protease adapter protein ClpS n=1 Tax=Aureliella helgolandensis TaxID=2527968 RepID=A0A518GEW1_9BACT|nr:ATP-dependent Clp protease adaptor ClpS [Aureliella helgolandensis]QDV27097.1 ATP-dependent Clp protease adapter protein ClpS [Aureliella helgolandensis]